MTLVEKRPQWSPSSGALSSTLPLSMSLIDTGCTLSVAAGSAQTSTVGGVNVNCVSRRTSAPRGDWAACGDAAAASTPGGASRNAAQMSITINVGLDCSARERQPQGEKSKR